jgi:hypothetical protein
MMDEQARYVVTAEHPAGWRIPRKGRTAKEARENTEAAVKAFHYSTYMNGEWVFSEAEKVEG